jgi:hypothetical protein
MTAHRGRLGAYALWQIRDYAKSPMIWTILAGSVFGAFPLIMMRLQASRMPGADVPYARAFEPFVAVLAFAAPMLAVVRMVSADRAPGLTRFLFAKPVGVRWYYAQAFFVRALAGLAVVAISAILINTLIGTVPWAEGLAAIGIGFVLIGGVGFLLSVLTKQDGGLLIAIYLIPDVLAQIIQAKESWKWWAQPLLTILPPMHLQDEIRRALLSDAELPRGDVIHSLLYGAGCFVLGVFLVRRLPLVR